MQGHVLQNKTLNNTKSFLSSNYIAIRGFSDDVRLRPQVEEASGEAALAARAEAADLAGSAVLAARAVLVLAVLALVAWVPAAREAASAARRGRSEDCPP